MIEKPEGKNIHHFKVVDSTNLIARQLAENGAPGYSVVIADEQRQGRGRLGRTWFSPFGRGLWFSILLRPDTLNAAAVAPITLVTAAVISRHFEEKYNLALKIKWPNDLLLGEKKVGGILTEVKSKRDLIKYLIVGIGLNLTQEKNEFPPDLAQIATSVSIESGNHPDRLDLFYALNDLLFTAYKSFFSEGFGSFYQLWLKYNVTLGREITISGSGGKLVGTALGLTRDGALLVKDKAGMTHEVMSGEII